MNHISLTGILTADPQPAPGPPADPASALIRVRPDSQEGNPSPDPDGRLVAVARGELAGRVVDFLRLGDQVVICGRARTAAERADDEHTALADIEITDIGPSLRRSGALLLRGAAPADPAPPRKVAVTTDDNDVADYLPGKQPAGQLTLDDSERQP